MFEGLDGWTSDSDTEILQISREKCQGKGVGLFVGRETIVNLAPLAYHLNRHHYRPAITVFALASTRFEHIGAYRIEVAPPNKPALIVLSTNPLGDSIILINDQQGGKRFSITLDEKGNAVAEWFSADGRTLKRLSVP